MSEAKLEKSTVNRLQEIFQQWKYPLPIYREAEGTYQQFGTEVTITIDDNIIGFHALGRTKKASKSNVAEKAIAFIEENYPHLLTPPPLPDLDPTLFPQPILVKKAHLNKQRAEAINMKELAKETEQLAHVHVGLDMGRLIQQSRQKKGFSQKDLAARINEKAQVVSEYEQGRAIPNDGIIKKLERALGVFLTGERAGQPKQ